MNSRRRVHRLLRTAAVLLLSGCRYHVEAKPLRTYIQRPPTCAAAVTVYERAEDVRRTFVPLAELSLWYPPDMVATPESELLAQREKAATWGANGLIRGHPRTELQSFAAKSQAIFVPDDSTLANRIGAQDSAEHSRRPA